MPLALLLILVVILGVAFLITISIHTKNRPKAKEIYKNLHATARDIRYETSNIIFTLRDVLSVNWMTMNPELKSSQLKSKLEDFRNRLDAEKPKIEKHNHFTTSQVYSKMSEIYHPIDAALNEYLRFFEEAKKLSEISANIRSVLGILKNRRFYSIEYLSDSEKFAIKKDLIDARKIIDHIFETKKLIFVISEVSIKYLEMIDELLEETESFISKIDIYLQYGKNNSLGSKIPHGEFKANSIDDNTYRLLNFEIEKISDSLQPVSEQAFDLSIRANN